jgi:LysM repeat protein
VKVTTGAALLTGILGLSGCGWWGGDNSASRSTLPPIRTTVPTTTLPPTTTTTVPSEYIVQKGDSLTRIAQQFGVTVAQLVAANNLPNPDHIEEGQRLTIPPPTVPSTTGPSTTAKAAAPAPPAASTTAHS